MDVAIEILLSYTAAIKSKFETSQANSINKVLGKAFSGKLIVTFSVFLDNVLECFFQALKPV